MAVKNSQLPALKSGNAGSCILPRISEFDQLNFQGFFRPGGVVNQRPKHYEGFLIQPQKDVGNDKGFSQVIGSSVGCQPLQRFLRARGKRLKPLVFASGAAAPG